MKLGVLFNCQHRMLAETLRLTIPGAEVTDYDIGQLRQDEALRGPALEDLASCDRVLSLYLGAEDGPLGSEAMRETMRGFTILPGFSFGGFHPDTVYIHTAHGYLDGFTHHYHSRLAVAGFLAGRTVRETTQLYNALIMGRAGYFSAFAQERMLVCQVFDQFGIDLNPMFDRWAGGGCFMHSINHPKAWCYVDVAVALARHAGLIGPETTLDPHLVSDELRFHPTHPVLPPLARRLGVPAEARFKPSRPHEHHAVPLERFVELEFERFGHAERHELEGTPGVGSLLAVLQ
ncbi:MAG: hypothetical protein H7345_10095 [Rubritepida sp.]|nr:hypothetical protein [Rubritepida sp.]